MPTTTVHLLCGFNGAGKTTYARRLAARTPTVRFTLDEWMLRLYPELCFDADGYPARAAVCQELIWETARQILAAGTDVILDWNQWSRARRAHWSARAADAGARACLHHIRVPVTTAIARVEARTAARTAGTHPLDAAGVRHLASIFEEPTDDEPVTLVRADHGRSPWTDSAP